MLTTVMMTLVAWFAVSCTVALLLGRVMAFAKRKDPAERYPVPLQPIAAQPRTQPRALPRRARRSQAA